MRLGAEITVALLPSDCRLRPDRKLIAAGLDEVEAAATGEVEQGANDGAPVLEYLGLGCGNVGAVEHQQGAALGALAAQVRPVEAAIQSFPRKGRVIGAVIHELPAEGGGKEGLGGREIPGGKLHIVQFFMGPGHGSFPLLQTICDGGLAIIWAASAAGFVAWSRAVPPRGSA